MGKQVLIQWESNWADEMDVSGFVVVSKKEADEFKQKLSDNPDKKISFLIGTNEEMNETYGRILKKCKFSKLTDKEADIIVKFFRSKHGFTGFYRCIMEEDDFDCWADEDNDGTDEPVNVIGDELDNNTTDESVVIDNPTPTRQDILNEQRKWYEDNIEYVESIAVHLDINEKSDKSFNELKELIDTIKFDFVRDAFLGTLNSLKRKGFVS